MKAYKLLLTSPITKTSVDGNRTPASQAVIREIQERRVSLEHLPAMPGKNAVDGCMRLSDSNDWVPPYH